MVTVEEGTDMPAPPKALTLQERVAKLEVHQGYAAAAIQAQTMALEKLMNTHEHRIDARFGEIEKKLASIAEKLEAANNADVRRSGVESGIFNTLRVFWLISGVVGTFIVQSIYYRLTGNPPP
jgi:hypothetical protein